MSKIDDNKFIHWKATVLGPKNSPYEGGTYLLDILFPRDYPFRAPKIKFLTKIFNPYVNFDGKIYEFLISGEWQPTKTCEQLIESIFHFIAEPDENHITKFLSPTSSTNRYDYDSFIDPNISHIYKTNKSKFNIIARKWAIKYANAPSEGCELYNSIGDERLNYELKYVNNQKYSINKTLNESEYSVTLLCPIDSPFENRKLKIDFSFSDYPNEPPLFFIKSKINNIEQKLIEQKINFAYFLLCEKWNDEYIFIDVLDLFYKTLNYNYFWDDFTFTKRENRMIEIIEELQKCLLLPNKNNTSKNDKKESFHMKNLRHFDDYFEEFDFLDLENYYTSKKYGALAFNENMSIIITSIDENIKYSAICKKSDKFIRIEDEFYMKYPEYEYYKLKNYFSLNGKKINRYLSLKENNINDNDIIILNYIT